jgi:hypothetical protein
MEWLWQEMCISRQWKNRPKIKNKLKNNTYENAYQIKITEVCNSRFGKIPEKNQNLKGSPFKSLRL